MKTTLCLLALAFAINTSLAQTAPSNSVTLRSYLELVDANDQVTRVYDGDSLISLKDTNIVSVCVKVYGEGNEIYNATSSDVIFLLGNEQPNVESTRGCLDRNQVSLFAKLKLSDGDVLMFRNVKVQVNGQLRSVTPLQIGRSKTE